MPFRVTLTAQATDETQMSTFKLIVTDCNRTIVLEKIKGKDTDSQNILNISEGFETLISGVYKATFIATDTNGNVTSASKSFTYKD